METIGFTVNQEDERDRSFDIAVMCHHSDLHNDVSTATQFVHKKTSNSKRSSSSSSSSTTLGGVYVDSSYTMRIHEMLENAEKEGHNRDIVGWLPHGRAFKIHNEKRFVTIMPRYFKAKLPNFLRWLRAWGFCRMTEGKDRGSWYHVSCLYPILPAVVFVPSLVLYFSSLVFLVVLMIR